MIFYLSVHCIEHIISFWYIVMQSCFQNIFILVTWKMMVCNKNCFCRCGDQYSQVKNKFCKTLFLQRHYYLIQSEPCSSCLTSWPWRTPPRWFFPSFYRLYIKRPGRCMYRYDWYHRFKASNINRYIII